MKEAVAHTIKQGVCLKLVVALACLLTISRVGMSQTTIVNYDFNAGSSFSALTPTLASNITCSLTSTNAWQMTTGIASGANAFTSNPTAGNALNTSNTSGYYEFQLGGPALHTYSSYKLYFQSMRATVGPTLTAIHYSTDGTTYTAFPTTQLPGNTVYAECQFDLSSVTAVNTATALYFRIVISGPTGGSGTKTSIAIDNMQIRATACSTPTLSISNPTASICSGRTTTLSASGASSYSWSPGGAATASIAVSPTVTSIYTVTGTTAGCTATLTTAVTVNALPTVTVSSSTATLCSGNTATLTVGGASTYSWSPGGATTPTVAVSPTVTTTYTVTGTNAAGCSKTQTLTLTIYDKPLLSLIRGSTICRGEYITLSETGASSYTWNPGGLNTATTTVNPTVTTTYTVTGASLAGCTSSVTALVTVNPSPTISVSVSSPAICAGSSSTLTAAGATTYTWNPGGVTSASVSVSPGVTTIYTVTGTATDCTSDITTTLTVNPLPVVSAGLNQTMTCTNTLVTLTGTTNAGSPSYSWTPAGDHPTLALNTTSATGTYTLKVTNTTTSCSNTSTVSVTTTCHLQVYAVLKKELDGTYYQTYDNALFFTVDGAYSAMSLNYAVYDHLRNPTSGLPINNSTMNNGDNRYELDITTLSPGYYVLELLNQKKEKLVLRFKK